MNPSQQCFLNGGAQVSSENPPECRACHGNPPQPIFNTYHLWPGVFGTNDDEIVIGSDEDTHFRRFIDSYKNHPSYKYLVGLEEVDYSKSKRDILRGKQDPSVKNETYGLPGLPSSLLLANIEASLDSQLFREIISHPKMRGYLYVLSAAEFCSRFQKCAR